MSEGLWCLAGCCAGTGEGMWLQQWESLHWQCVQGLGGMLHSEVALLHQRLC